ncbi:MAG TPA: flavin reductase family protein [Candidatus Limnocylindria bacterium]|nr:flavin reductase family protein [Candidatus Limnocylindria bacterium]
MTITSSDRYAVARTVLSRIAHAVAIVGAAKGDERGCGTGTAMYVSLDPAMIAIAEHTGSRTTRLIQETGEFSVSLLHDSQQDLAVAAGRSAAGPDKFATLKIRTVEAPAGLHAPGVAGAVAILWCKVVNTVETGDHLLFVGEIVQHQVDERRWDPLLRYGRRYFRLGHWTSDESPEGYPT